MTALQLAGEEDRAAACLEQLQRAAEADGRRDQAVDELGSGSPTSSALCERLRRREVETIKAMKLDHLWESSPFPVELPAAERAKAAEPSFSVLPWLTDTGSTLMRSAPDHAGETIFARTLVGLTVPNDGALILLSAYFDASGRAGGAFSVAGFAFGPGRAKKAASSWHRLWRDTPCHMTDLHTRMEGSDFEGWTKVQAGKRLKDSVAIINRYASNGVAVSCDFKEMNELAPRSAAKGSELSLDGFSRLTRHART